MVSAKLSTPHVLAVHAGDIKLFGFLGLVRMVGARVDTQVGKLDPSKRAARKHAFHRLLHHALGETPFQDRFGGAFFDAADESCVMMVDFLFALATGENSLGSVDDDDIVAIIDMRR